MNRSDDNPWLEQATQRLRSRLNPSLILLFGSLARGTATRTSDVDLLVVWESDEAPLARIGRVLELLADSPRPLEVLALTPAELEARRSSRFMQTILREGKILYERRAA
jgi:predicted nucleotidyltransferase